MDSLELSRKTELRGKTLLERYTDYMAEQRDKHEAAKTLAMQVSAVSTMVGLGAAAGLASPAIVAGGMAVGAVTLGKAMYHTYKEGRSSIGSNFGEALDNAKKWEEKKPGAWDIVRQKVARQFEPFLNKDTPVTERKPAEDRQAINAPESLRNDEIDKLLDTPQKTINQRQGVEPSRDVIDQNNKDFTRSENKDTPTREVKQQEDPKALDRKTKMNAYFSEALNFDPRAQNTITQGLSREAASDNQALRSLEHEITEAHKLLPEIGINSTMETRAELRESAAIETEKRHPLDLKDLNIAGVTGQRWAELDAAEFNVAKNQDQVVRSLEIVAENFRDSSVYKKSLQEHDQNLYAAAQSLNEKLDRQAQDELNKNNRQDVAADESRRLSMLDAAAIAQVEARRKSELKEIATTILKNTFPSKDLSKADRFSGTHQEKNPEAVSLSRIESLKSEKPIKRPLAPDEIEGTLKEKYIITKEKFSILDKAATTYCHKTGEAQGRVAFEDLGKTLTTTAQDKNTIHSMIELAQSKNWKEITVNGTDEFKRLAWLDASLAGLKVHGYTPREADLQLLNATMEREKQSNSINMADTRTKKTQTDFQDRDASGIHVDVDKLTKEEKAVLDNSKAYLESKNLGDKFTQATLKELENKLRSERAYVGVLVEHGAAPYKFNKDNEDSYFVKLKTERGEQTIWGKKLPHALSDVSIGQSIYLKNSSKESVQVQEKILDDTGKKVGVRTKEAELNTWTATPISHLTEKQRAEAAERSSTRKPSLPIFDKFRATPQPERTQIKETDQQRTPQRDR